MTDFSNKTVIITGASRGIGATTAYYFADKGAKVILAARSKEVIKKHADKINTKGGHGYAYACDVSKSDNFKSLIEYTMEQTGRIDILVNNAGIIDPIARLSESDPQAWANVIDTNVKGVYHGLRFTIPAMLKNRAGGTIINISSGAATSALEGWSHYCCSKAAVLSLTKCAHKEYDDKGINVIGLSPGTVATDMQKTIKNSGINPVSQLDWEKHIPAEWVAKSIAFLCSDKGAKYNGTDFSLKNNDGRKEVGLPLMV